MSRSVLIVDDEKHATDMLSEALAPLGCEVRVASNGEEALRQAEDKPVDLLITDIMMPGLNGTELFYKIKKIDPFIQVILITGYPSLRQIAEMLEAGANDFLIKPFDLNKLAQLSSEAFGRIDRWRALRAEWAAFSKKARQSRA